MLLKHHILRQIKDGKTDLAFRRWDRPRVKVGTRLRTAVGVVEVLEVDRVTLKSVTPKDAARAGAESLDALLGELRRRSGQVFRIRLRHGGEDPRVALRKQDDLTDEEIDALRAKLEGMDKRAKLPWTRQTLEMIRDRPGVVARDLAASRGEETRPFKTRVRRLKELGLTESLEVGYRLSPRGRALLDNL